MRNHIMTKLHIISAIIIWVELARIAPAVVAIVAIVAAVTILVLARYTTSEA